MKKKEINVKEIFLKEGWISKYHYIMDVMKSCETLEQMIVAWRWGRNILKNDTKRIEKKYNLNTAKTYPITEGYVETLRNISYNFEETVN